MWTLKQLQDPNLEQVCIRGKWIPARPLNYQKGYFPLMQRIKHAWAVFTCRAEAFIWPEGQ